MRLCLLYNLSRYRQVFDSIPSQAPFGQTILEEGPKWHKGKQGTPTMGGIMFIVAIVVVTIISTVIYAFTGADLVNSFFADIPRECMFIFCGLGLAVANGFIGFIDDYIKVVKSVTSVLQRRKS